MLGKLSLPTALTLKVFLLATTVLFFVDSVQCTDVAETVAEQLDEMKEARELQYSDPEYYYYNYHNNSHYDHHFYYNYYYFCFYYFPSTYRYLSFYDIMWISLFTFLLLSIVCGACLSIWLYCKLKAKDALLPRESQYLTLDVKCLWWCVCLLMGCFGTVLMYMFASTEIDKRVQLMHESEKKGNFCPVGTAVVTTQLVNGHAAI